MEPLFEPQDCIDNGLSFLLQKTVEETYMPHSHTFFEIFLVYSGTAIHNCNGISELISENAFILMRPSDTHSYTIFRKNEFSLLSMAFSGELFFKSCDFLGISPEIFLESPRPITCVLEGKELIRIGKMLLQVETFPYGAERRRYCSSIAPYLIMAFLRSMGKEQNPHTLVPMWLTNTLSAMETEENLCEGLPAMIRISGKTQEHLTRQMRQYLCMTPTEFINAKRIDLAAMLLLQSELPITDIAFRTGYQTLGYFNRLFKQMYGCSPRGFRKSNRKPETESETSTSM